MQPPDGDSFYLKGRFHDVDSPSRIAFSFNWDPADPADVETLAELSFRAIDDSTELVLAQGAFKTDERLALHRDGWAESFEKLGELVHQHP